MWEAEIAHRLERLGGGGYPAPGREALVLQAPQRGLRGAWITRAAVTRARRAPGELKAMLRNTDRSGDTQAVVRRFVLSAALALAGDADGREEMVRWASALDPLGAADSEAAGRGGAPVDYEPLAREAVSVLAEDRAQHQSWLLSILDNPALAPGRRRTALRVLSHLEFPDIAQRARVLLAEPELAPEALRCLAVASAGGGEGFWPAVRAAFPGVGEEELLEVLARMDAALLEPLLRGRGERARRAEGTLAERFRLSGDPAAGRLLLAQLAKASDEAIESLSWAFDPPPGDLDPLPRQQGDGELLRRELAALGAQGRRRGLDALCSRLLKDPPQALPLRAGDAARRLLVGLDPQHVLDYLGRRDAGEGVWATAQRALLLCASGRAEAEVLLQPLLADRRGLALERRGGGASARLTIAQLAQRAGSAQP